jgi:lysophospholipase L1-like esterase
MTNRRDFLKLGALAIGTLSFRFIEEATKPYKAYLPIVTKSYGYTVWPIGDSITAGFNGFNYRSIMQSFKPVKYVGSINTDGLYHDGHGGLTVNEIIDDLENYIGYLTDIPDHIFIHLGTNDILQGLYPNSVQKLVNKIKNYFPYSNIYVAKIIRFQYKYAGLNQTVHNFNLDIDKLNDANVIDMENLLSIYDYFHDGIHPNMNGFIKIAQNFSKYL